MMILFNHKEQVIRYVRNDVTRVLEHKQVLTDEKYVSDNLYAEIEALDDEVLAQLEYVAIPVEDMTYQYHYFWVQKHETRGNITSIQGVQSGIEALRKTPVRDFRPHEREARYAIDHVLDGTNWRAGYVADTGKRSTTVYYVSVFDALKKFCSVWQLEMQFFVEVTNGQIGARFIDFKQRLGKRRGARVVYGHNALEIVKEEERTELYTALIGRGKGEEVSSEEENKSGQAGYGRKINFEEIEWSRANGDPVDKPAGQLYVEIPQATERYGVRGANGQMKPKIGFVEFQDEEDKHELIKLTYAELERLSRPQVLFKTSSVYIEGQIGDVIRVVRPDRQIDYETRIFEITWDRLMARAVDIKLGDQINESANKRESRILSSAVDTIRENVGHAISQQLDSIVSANGFNSNYYMAEDPRDKGHVPKINDLWFKPDPDSEGDYIMYVWNGEFWEELIRTNNNERVKQLVQEMEEYWRKADEAFEKQKAESERRLEEFNQSLEQFRQSLDENDVEADRKVNEFRKQLERDQQERDRIREENQSKMDEFERHLSEFEAQLKSFDAEALEGLDKRIAEALDKADISQKINERVRNIINDAGFGNALQDIEDKLEQTSQTARVNAEIIGGDGKTRYNKNRTDTTNATIQLETGYVEIGSNGPDGWPTDESGRLKELTISFEAECIPRGSSTVTVRLSTPLWYGAAIEMRPDSQYYPQADKKATAQATELFAVYNGQYTLAVNSPWFTDPTTQRVTIDGNKTVTVSPQLKTIADGNLEAEFYGEWSENPEVILDGGS
ncbi:phage tail spike protein [Dolosigranulum savutiense]|uniref:Phage tail spike protein n=1 Tax=Dolosigranulum savutiense TaxID=3110288 RepID=A0AB74U4G6_9LACT